MSTVSAISQDTLEVVCGETNVRLKDGDILTFTEDWAKFEQGETVEVSINIDYYGGTFSEKEYYISLSNPGHRKTYTGEDGIAELICGGVANIQ